MRMRIAVTTALVGGSLIASAAGLTSRGGDGVSLRHRRGRTHTTVVAAPTTTKATSAPTTKATSAPTTKATTVPAPTVASSTAPTPATSAPATATTTAATTATTAAPATTTATNAPSSPATVASGVPCGLVGAVFCETFDAPKGNGSRTGDLDPVLWGVSRIGVINPGTWNNDITQTSMQGCGTTAWSKAPNDVRICNGVMFESVNDAGGVASLHTYPKQPFDWAGRTGKVVFDVSADSDGSHGAWPEFVITDKPVPGTRVNISGGIPGQLAVNEIGFSIDGCTAGPGGNTGIGRIFVTRNSVYEEVGFQGTGCVKKGSLTSLNRFEVRLSQNRMEVWAGDPGSTTLKQIAVADNLNLQFTKGLVWLDDVHYNARKSVEPCECGTQWNHTFAWDNLAFDGPKTYRDLGFDVPDPGVAGSPGPWFGEPTIRTGWQVGRGPLTLNVPGVFRKQTPTSALVVLNTYSFGRTIPSVSVNGNAPIATPYPATAGTGGWLSIAIPVPVDQVRDGANTLTFTSDDGSTTVTNISIILVAGAAVP